MMRATGFLLGAVLMLALFLLALDAGLSPTLVKEVVSSAVDTPVNITEPVPAEAAPVEQAIDSAALPVADTTDRNDATTMSRYLVWSPFRSEWAAQGFAQRLTLATEVPVEVVNTGPGNYQVVFSYRDDAERQALVERIETVTGLELE